MERVSLKSAEDVLIRDVKPSGFLVYPAGRNELYEDFMADLRISTTGSQKKVDIGGKIRIIQDTTNPRVFVIKEIAPSIDGGQTKTRQIIFVGIDREIDEFES